MVFLECCTVIAVRYFKKHLLVATSDFWFWVSVFIFILLIKAALFKKW